mmetsp:Transcript_32878/g.94581  ORF Transcript_32878/g.94581 Transcript_32878/m.94581 type:complete len:200 (+) Transcript_32878:538-1137(+)
MRFRGGVRLSSCRVQAPHLCGRRRVRAGFGREPPKVTGLHAACLAHRVLRCGLPGGHTRRGAGAPPCFWEKSLFFRPESHQALAQLVLRQRQELLKCTTIACGQGSRLICLVGRAPRRSRRQGGRTAREPGRSLRAAPVAHVVCAGAGGLGSGGSIEVSTGVFRRAHRYHLRWPLCYSRASPADTPELFRAAHCATRLL